MRRLAAILVIVVAAGLGAACGTCAQNAGFSDWAAIVVAGDDHASHTDNLTETIDNARRDVAAALIRKGFSPDNMAQFSAQPARHAAAPLRPADVSSIAASLRDHAQRARGGCLIYFTSHGAPQGVAVGESLLSPSQLARIVDETCGARPTVVVMSACYSGVFVPALAGPDRMVLTAARSDRSSFGCGESDRYPFFDACVLESLPASSDFLALAPKVKACVARREREEGMAPPSHPQVWVGAQFAARPRPFAPGE